VAADAEAATKAETSTTPTNEAHQFSSNSNPKIIEGN
jgi:hypothetical protein